ncbi:Hypp8686 [Branchiostoma lanceolatum]|uniref:Hypp8686 protein n=1 Tax=Branchiostoma lanceolatum TaxID=7740 RepID=A0A8J9Z8E4_BRALA|nr:Hypp8686 [Branchiostoma lanceolatum]
MAFLCPFRLRPNQRKPGYNKKYGSVKGQMDAIGAKLHGDAHLLSNAEYHDEVIRTLEAAADLRCPADGGQRPEFRHSGSSMTFERRGSSYIVHPIQNEPPNNRLSQERVDLVRSGPMGSNKENIGQANVRSKVVPTERKLTYGPDPKVVRDRSSYLQMLEDLIEEGPAGCHRNGDKGEVWSKQKGNRLFTEEELGRRVGESPSKPNRLSYAMMLEGQEERRPAAQPGTAGRGRVPPRSSPLTEEQLQRLRTLRRDRNSYLIMVDGLLDESRRSSVATSQRWSIATCSEDFQELRLDTDTHHRLDYDKGKIGNRGKKQYDISARRGRADGGPSSSTSPESSTSNEGSKPDIRRQRPRRKVSTNSNRGMTKSASSSSTSTASTVFLDDKQAAPPSGHTKSAASRIGHRIITPPGEQAPTAAEKPRDRSSVSSIGQAVDIMEDMATATPSVGSQLGERRGSISSISSAVAVVRSIQMLSPSEQAEQESDSFLQESDSGSKATSFLQRSDSKGNSFLNGSVSKADSFLQTDLPPPTPFRDTPDVVQQTCQNSFAVAPTNNTVGSTEKHSGKRSMVSNNNVQQEKSYISNDVSSCIKDAENTATTGSGFVNNSQDKTTSKASLWRPYLSGSQERSKANKPPLSDVTNLLWSNVLLRATLGASGGATNGQQGNVSGEMLRELTGPSPSMSVHTSNIQSSSTTSLAQYSLLTLTQGQVRSPADPSPVIPPAPHTTPDLQVATFPKQPIGQATVMFDFMAVEENDLSVMRGETVTLLNMDDVDWVFARTDDGAEGFIPRNFCSPCSSQLQTTGANVSDTSSLQLTMATKDATFLTCGTQDSSWAVDTIFEEEEEDEDAGEGRDAMATVSVEIQKLIASALEETDQMASHGGSKFTHPISATPHLGTGALAKKKAAVSMGTSSLMNDLETTAQNSFLSSIDLLDLTQDDPLHCYQPANEGPADGSSLPTTGADETADSVATSESAWPDEDLRALVKQTHKFLVLYDFAAQAVDEVSVSAGELVYVNADKQQEDDWLWVYVPSSGDSGYIPQAFTRPIVLFDLK